MNKKTLSKIIFFASIVLFGFSLYTYSAAASYGGAMLIVALLLNNTSAGASVCFGGLGFSSSSKNGFCGAFMINLAVFFIMNIIAAAAAVGSSAVTISFVGLLQIPALAAVFVLCLLDFYFEEKLTQRAAIITASVVTVIYLGLTVYEFVKPISDIRLNVCAVLGYVQISLIAWHPASKA